MTVIPPSAQRDATHTPIVESPEDYRSNKLFRHMHREEIKALAPPKHTIAFAYSSKDRVALSRQTIAPLLAGEGYDIYWIDGSKTDEGKALPFSYEA